jgi:hypothetical protein
MEHPDVTSALRTGYPGFAVRENADDPENRAAYLRERRDELLEWLERGYPEILEEFIRHYRWDYDSWLN